MFEGRDLLTMRSRSCARSAAPKIGMIFQDPLSSLHPFYKVGWQIVEMIRLHDKRHVEGCRPGPGPSICSGWSGIPQPDRRVDDYPHQFSGGMRQRAMIAMAMALNPKLLIADEPTTALDVTVQAQVLQVMKTLQDEFGTAIIMITHDLGVIADVADEVIVMYAGAVMEKRGPAARSSSPTTTRTPRACCGRCRPTAGAGAAAPHPRAAAQPDQPARLAARSTPAART